MVLQGQHSLHVIYALEEFYFKIIYNCKLKEVLELEDRIRTASQTQEEVHRSDLYPKDFFSNFDYAAFSINLKKLPRRENF